MIFTSLYHDISLHFKISVEVYTYIYIQVEAFEIGHPNTLVAIGDRKKCFGRNLLGFEGDIISC